MTSSASWIDDISMKDLEQKTKEIYERLRREAPLTYIPALGAYVASTAELCQEIARSDFEGVLSHPEFAPSDDPASSMRTGRFTATCD